MHCALRLPGNSSTEKSVLYVTRQLTELILTNGFKKASG
jgi:hypothetical protein